MEIEILSIKRQPKWKFWKIDQWEVTVKADGKTKQVSIYDNAPYFESLFLEYVRKKVLYGDQWLNEDKFKETEKLMQRLIGRTVKTD